MASWQHTLNLKDIWQGLREQDNPDYSTAARLIAKRIKDAVFYEDFKDDLEEIVSDFEDASNRDEINFAYAGLCDWGDTPLPTLPGDMQKKACWIKTF